MVTYEYGDNIGHLKHKLIEWTPLQVIYYKALKSQNSD